MLSRRAGGATAKANRTAFNSLLCSYYSIHHDIKFIYRGNQKIFSNQNVSSEGSWHFVHAFILRMSVLTASSSIYLSRFLALLNVSMTFVSFFILSYPIFIHILSDIYGPFNRNISYPFHFSSFLRNLCSTERITLFAVWIREATSSIVFFAIFFFKKPIKSGLTYLFTFLG